MCLWDGVRLGCTLLTSSPYTGTPLGAVSSGEWSFDLRFKKVTPQGSIEEGLAGKKRLEGPLEGRSGSLVALI